MLTESEYAELIRAFMAEVNHLWVHEDPAPLRALPTFEQINSDYLTDLRDPTNEPVQTLREAFAFVDEFMAADWARIGHAAYAAYSGRSLPEQDPPARWA
jgi:hypothetical protein